MPKKPTGKHPAVVVEEPATTRPKRASTQPSGSRSRVASIPPPHEQVIEAPEPAVTLTRKSGKQAAVKPNTERPTQASAKPASTRQTATGVPTVPRAAATMIERGAIRPPARPSQPQPSSTPAPSRASPPDPATPPSRTSHPLPTSRDLRAPEPATTMVGSGPIRPPAGRAQPVAPDPAATAVGRPTDYRLPAKPARTRKPPAPPPEPSRKPTVPRPAVVKASGPPDPAKLRALLEAILAAPDDDDARHAYADLLDAHNDPRGQFIRIGLDPEDVDAATFAELHARHSAKWTKTLRALGKTARWRWHRGFVHELRVTGWDAGCTPENLSAVLGVEPVAELSIDGGEPELLARLVAVPGVERVRRLAVSGWSPDEGGSFVGRILGKATRVGGVTELRVGVKLGDAGIRALVDADALAAVTHLAVANGDVSTAAFAALADSQLGQQLEILEWLRDPITSEMATLVAMMPSLRTFVVSAAHADSCRKQLRSRFRERFVVEDEPGLPGCLIDGVRGVSYRAQPKR